MIHYTSKIVIRINYIYRKRGSILPRFASIASGSSGNSIYFGSDNTHILIDAGISNKRIEEGLKNLGLKVSDLSGVFITHEHSDHIQGLKILTKKYQIPIYATKGTLDYIKKKKIIEGYEGLCNIIAADTEFSVADINAKVFKISHDASEPVGFRLSTAGKSVAVATDMGVYDEYIVDNLQNLDAIMLEANHDIRMLEVGPYPYHLKRRILGNKGHLCNENAGKLLARILHDKIKHIFLGHLSKENNYPSLAYETVKVEIDEADVEYRGSDFRIDVAKRDAMSEVVLL